MQSVSDILFLVLLGVILLANVVLSLYFLVAVAIRVFLFLMIPVWLCQAWIIFVRRRLLG